MSIISIGTAFNIDLEFEIAEFHKRLLAYIIDFVLLIIFLYSMKYLLYNGLVSDEEKSVGLDILIISLPMLLYSLLTELWMNGQTVGKKIMGIRVISLEGGEPTLGQFILRWITKFFEWPFMFGYIAFSNTTLIVYCFITGLFGIEVVIIIAVSPKNQRLGDMIAGTVVVNAKSALTVADTVFMQINQTDYKVMFPQVMRLSDRDINTIKSVLTQAGKRNNYDMCHRVAMKIKEVLNIESDLYVDQFLEKLLEDYNYLATKE
ncbi:MAG: RDD family protein [Chitinophagaceae bacterium]|nr:RDD family protein [Chitinophagaceae bacterium]